MCVETHTQRGAIFVNGWKFSLLELSIYLFVFRSPSPSFSLLLFLILIHFLSFPVTFLDPLDVMCQGFRVYMYCVPALYRYFVSVFIQHASR